MDQDQESGVTNFATSVRWLASITSQREDYLGIDRRPLQAEIRVTTIWLSQNEHSPGVDLTRQRELRSICFAPACSIQAN